MRESQVAVFVNECGVADVFGPGMYKLSADAAGADLPEELGQALRVARSRATSTSSARASRSTRSGHAAAHHHLRDRGISAPVRLRAFGNYSFRIGDAKLFHTEISGTRDIYTVADLDGQLRGWSCRTINAIASAACRSSTSRPTRSKFAQALAAQLVPEFAQRSASSSRTSRSRTSRCPRNCRRSSTRRSGMGMVGNDMGKFMQYQTAQAIPAQFAEGAANGGGIAGDAMGLGAGVALRPVLRRRTSRRA